MTTCRSQPALPVVPLGRTAVLAAALPVCLTACTPESDRERRTLAPIPGRAANHHAIDWSPDGRWIAYSAFRTEGSEPVLDIWRVRPDGSENHRFIATDESESHPRWSPDGTRVVFKRAGESGVDFFLADSAGLEIERLTFDPATPKEGAAAWAPDGSRIAFAAGEGEDLEIFEFVLSTRETVRVTDNDWPARAPAFSPDGRYLTLHGGRRGARDIYRLEPEAGLYTQLTDAPHYEGYARWSPDGTRLVYIVILADGGDDEVFVMDPDGGRKTRLTNAPDWDLDPVWSPDGESIAFTSRRDGRRGVFVMAASGGEPRKITNTTPSDFIAVVHDSGVETAVRLYREAHSINPDARYFFEPEASNLARRYLREGREADALAIAEVYASAYPESCRAWNDVQSARLGSALPGAPSIETVSEALDEDEVSDVLGIVKASEDEFPGTIRCRFSERHWNALGYDRLAAGEAISAVRAFEVLVALFPESPNAHDSLGEGYAAVGETRRAIESYRRSLELDPDNENARRQLTILGSGS